MLLLGHWPALVGADARLFELRPVAGIDGSSLMGHRVGSCAFSPITLVDSAIPIISVLQTAEEALASRVVRAAALPRHGPGQAVSLAYADPAGPSVMASPVRVADRALARGERPACGLEAAVGELRVRARADRPAIQARLLLNRHRIAAINLGPTGQPRTNVISTIASTGLDLFIIRQDHRAWTYYGHPFCQDEKTRLPAEILRLDS